ncbi:Gfo/Idh/MocA family oxidoreductase [Mesobacillus foraminis]|uniref:Gfo/Idh/MocA family protein n=1 Tax=Mesobacillus foraminis TaxID=279826 RepID=UPI001BEAE7F2|nr:Gfo/Idh/MocA family oxidoreductase [Mesobacillus foraminis]MBT2757846.1 Gfo/Idh/MocA family oxidoreductase [Mesobacillus foraminis]
MEGSHYGTGYFSEMHLTAWREQKNAKVVSMCDLNYEKLVGRARQFGIPEQHLYTSPEEMLEKEQIDIIDIITGPESHPSLVKLAANAKKHMLCQKPFAVSQEKAEEMVGIAKNAGVRLMVTENWRWYPHLQYLKGIIDSDIVGNINFVKYLNNFYFTPLMNSKDIKQPYFKNMPKLLTYEMGTHWFDVWRFLFGEPNRLYAELKKVSPYIVGDDLGTVLIGHDDFHGIMEMSWASRRNLTTPKQEQLLIETDRNSIIIYENGLTKLIDQRGETILYNQIIKNSKLESFISLQRHFLSCLESGEEFQTSGADNLKTLRLVFSAYESSANKEVIRLPL